MASKCLQKGIAITKNCFHFLYCPRYISSNGFVSLATTSTQSQVLRHDRHLMTVKTLFNRNLSNSNSGTEEEEDDDNDRALKELDITLLKPHPEWRNVASGPVWGKDDDFYDLLWKRWLDRPYLEKIKELHETEWQEYSKQHGINPDDYFFSEDFNKRYGSKTTWADYVRNKKGYIQKQRTRKTCIRKGEISTGSPCPLCRDDKLLVTYQNLPLLHDYIDEHTGQLHHSLRTGVCQMRWKRLVESLHLAREYGLLHNLLPFVKFNMKDYELNAHTL